MAPAGSAKLGCCAVSARSEMPSEREQLIRGDGAQANSPSSAPEPAVSRTRKEACAPPAAGTAQPSTTSSAGTASASFGSWLTCSPVGAGADREAAARSASSGTIGEARQAHRESVKHSPGLRKQIEKLERNKAES